MSDCKEKSRTINQIFREVTSFYNCIFPAMTFACVHGILCSIYLSQNAFVLTLVQTSSIEGVLTRCAGYALAACIAYRILWCVHWMVYSVQSKCRILVIAKWRAHSGRPLGEPSMVNIGSQVFFFAMSGNRNAYGNRRDCWRKQTKSCEREVQFAFFLSAECVGNDGFPADSPLADVPGER